MSNDLSTSGKTFLSEVGGLNPELNKRVDQTLPTLAKGIKAIKAEFDDVLKQEITVENCKRARELRLKIVPIRTSANKERLRLNRIDNKVIEDRNHDYKTLEGVLKPMEESLMSMEKYEENLEAERVQKLYNERMIEIQKIDPEAEIPAILGSFSEEVFQNHLKGLSAAKIEREEEARKQAEEEAKKQLDRDRRYQCSRLVDFIDNFDTLDFGSLSEDEYKVLVDDAKSKREDHEKEQQRIQDERDALIEEEAYAENARIDEERRLIAVANEYGAKLVKKGYSKKRNGNYEKEGFEILFESLKTMTVRQFNKRVKDIDESIEAIAEKARREEEERLAAEEQAKLALAPDKEKLTHMRSSVLSLLESVSEVEISEDEAEQVKQDYIEKLYDAVSILTDYLEL